MTLSLVGSDWASDANNSGTGTGTLSFSILSGDLVVLYVNVNQTGTASITPTQGTGAAWTTAWAASVPSGETARHGLWYKEANSSEPTSIDVTWSGANAGGLMVWVFRSTNSGSWGVDLAAAEGVDFASAAAMDLDAIDGRTYSADVAQVVGAGKDNRSSGVGTYNSPPTGWSVDVPGQPDDQSTGGAYALSTSSGTWASGLELTGASNPQDVTYSLHMAFSEPTGGGGTTFTTGTPPSLSLTTFAATASLNVDITLSTPQALATAVHAATVSYTQDVSFTTALASLTATPLAASASLNKQFDTAVQALATALHAASVSYTTDVAFTTALAAMTLAEQAATVDFSGSTAFTTSAPQALGTTTHQVTADFTTAFTTALAAISTTSLPVTVSFNKDISTSLASLTTTPQGATIQINKVFETGTQALGLAIYSVGVNEAPAATVVVSANRRTLTFLKAL